MKILKNVSIFTGGEKPKFFNNGILVWDEEKIVYVGENNKEYKGEVIDGKGKLVMPGLILAHDHLYSVLSRGIPLKNYHPENFLEILKNLWWKLDLALDRESVYYSALVGIIDAIRKGTTTIIDHHASFGYILGSLDELERASVETGIRLSTCFEVSNRWGEVKAKESIKENIRFIEKLRKKKNPLVSPTFGMHAQFTIGEKTIKECAEAGNALDVGFHIHVAEDISDREDSIEKYGVGVVERLLKENILGKRTLAIHAIHIDEKEKEILKETDTMVIHNPESNMNNAVGVSDVIGMMNRGILLGLGTDGFTQNMWRETQVANILHKLNKKDPNVGFMESYKMLFVNNPKIAERIFNKKIGAIEEGSVPDFIMLSYTPPTPLNEDNFFGHFLFGLSPDFVEDVVISGRFVMKGREIITLDAEKIERESRKITEKLWERFNSI